MYDNAQEKWMLINPLVQIGKQIHKGLQNHIEYREQKPMPLIQEDDYRKKISALPNNWQISSDGFNIIMDKPNDVALYSSLAEKQLKLAETYLVPKLKALRRNRQDYFVGRKKELTEFFDYFESVIGAVIFSYTSIEAFANICVPYNYVATVNKHNGKILKDTKVEIEKYWKLSDKLKVVLYEVLSTTDPVKSDWWDDFIALEQLRDEIIHTKQSKSESRYTKLLSQKTFKVIGVNTRIIKFFGDFMAITKPRDLQEFPYGFGHDEIIPSITFAAGYKSSYKVLHNVDLD